MSAKTSTIENPSQRKLRALAAVADCSERTREIVGKMPFSNATPRDRILAEKLLPIARRALNKHGDRLA